MRQRTSAANEEGEMTLTWHGNSACERWRAAMLLLALLVRYGLR